MQERRREVDGDRRSTPLQGAAHGFGDIGRCSWKVWVVTQMSWKSLIRPFASPKRIIASNFSATTVSGGYIRISRRAGRAAGWGNLAFGVRIDVIAKADIDLTTGLAPSSRPATIALTPWYFSSSRTGFDVQARGVEDDAVGRHLDLADRGEQGGDGGRTRVALAEQVQIAGGPEDMLGPGHEQHGALEDIAGRAPRFGSMRKSRRSMA